MQITGYTDRWTIAAGELLGVKVSSRKPTFFARLVRHLGPIASPQDWVANTTGVGCLIECHTGQWRSIKLGSYFAVDPGVVPSGEIIGITTRIYPTSIGRYSNSVCALEFERIAIELDIGREGGAVLRVEGSGGTRSELVPEMRFLSKRWQEVSLEIHRKEGWAALSVGGRSVRIALDQGLSGTVDGWTGAFRSITLGAAGVGGQSYGNFDGKIESPRLYQKLTGGGDQGARTLAHWSFAEADMSGFLIADRTATAAPARLANGPARAVTSSSWSASTADFKTDPSQYDAIRLSRDDLSDAQWPDAFVLTIPEEVRTGAYSLVLSLRPVVDWSDRESFDALPLFVTPGAEERNRLAIVLPTFSYRAYANSILFEDADGEVFQRKRKTVSEPLYLYAGAHGLRSLYDRHADESGCHLASLSRPLATVRADFVSMLQGFPHQFSADLEILGFVAHIGLPCSILTDEYLHAHGAAALHAYDAVITGSHPEYATAALLDAYRGYAGQGGSIVYLGGNGFYWSAALSAGLPSLLEVRRNRGTWTANPGEMVRQLDGNRGGLWRDLGCPPNLTFAVGFSAVGFSGDGHYRLSPGLDREALSPRLRSVVEKLGDEPFGIAGLELDAYSQDLGSSPDAVILASVAELPDGYVPPVEEIAATEQLLPDANQALKQRARGDIVFERRRTGGLLFSVGSIRWTSGLSDAEDKSRVQAITQAVIYDFLEDAAERSKG
jgi:N,N-dimethylformamidase